MRDANRPNRGRGNDRVTTQKDRETGTNYWARRQRRRKDKDRDRNIETEEKAEISNLSSDSVLVEDTRRVHPSNMGFTGIIEEMGTVVAVDEKTGSTCLPFHEHCMKLGRAFLLA